MLEILLGVIVVELGALLWKAYYNPEVGTCYYCKRQIPAKKLKMIAGYFYCPEHSRRTYER
jgi:hypothetical protein